MRLVGATVAFTVNVQPPLPQTAPLTYTLTNVLPDGLEPIFAIPPGDGRGPRLTRSPGPRSTNGEAMSVTYEAMVAENVALDSGIVNQIATALGRSGAARRPRTLCHGRRAGDHHDGVPMVPLDAVVSFTVTVTNRGILPAKI